DVDSGTVRYYDGAGNGTILLDEFFNLTIAGTARTHSLNVVSHIYNTLTVTSGTFATANNNLDIDVDCIQDNGIVNAGSAQITILRDLILNGGTFNANTSLIQVAEDFDSSGGGTFAPDTGTVEITNHTPAGAPDTSVINGSNSFYQFICNADDKVITFTAGTTTTILAAGRFEIDPVSGAGSEITMQSSATPGAPYPGGPTPDFGLGAIAQQWSININIAASRLIQHVDVDLSWSTNFIVIEETLVNVVWCYNWGSTNPVLETYTIDDEPNGKIDIYVRTAATLNDDFTGFNVTIDGYLLDTTYTNGCDTGTTPNDNWFIIRLRQDRTTTGTRGLDTDATPTWRIDSNSSLLADGTTSKYVMLSGAEETATDNAAPIIGYSLAAGGGYQVFVHLSEPVYNGAAPAALVPANFSFGGNPPTIQQINSREYLLTFPAVIDVADVIAGTPVTYTNIVDQVGLTLDAAASPYDRRVSDIILAIPGSEPVNFTMFDSTPRDLPTAGIGYITVFDGSGFVQDDTVVQDMTEDAPGSTATHIVWDLKTSGNLLPDTFWYPDPATASLAALTIPDVYGLVSSYRTTADEIAKSGSAFPVNWADAEIVNETLFEFYVRFPSTLLYARLDAPTASNWYRSVRPFAFGIHRPQGQHGTVTIHKNVINPNNNEITMLHYMLPRAGNVTIQVFTLAGDVVRVIQSGNQAAGEYSVSWDGRNSGGRIVARGLYFIKIVGPDIDEMRKVMVVK
ncbi:MAG: hypothetical protein JW904_01275, partial [Spirochaetales bacterium]|nr:hypothetical protein [Spirochaetales bacterium]